MQTKIENLASEIVDSCFQVHSELGPGLLESTYQHCLAHELRERGIKIEVEKSMPVVYKDTQLNCGYRIDILVDNRIILELKSVEKIHPIHKAQLITYLKLAEINLGFLINFNVPLIKNGINRFVNDYWEGF